MMHEPGQDTSSTQSRSEPISEEPISESLLQEELLAEEEMRMLHHGQASPEEMSENASASPNPTGDVECR